MQMVRFRVLWLVIQILLMIKGYGKTYMLLWVPITYYPGFPLCKHNFTCAMLRRIQTTDPLERCEKVLYPCLKRKKNAVNYKKKNTTNLKF